MPRIISPYGHLPDDWIDRVMNRADLTGVDVYDLDVHVGPQSQLVITYRTDDAGLGQADVGVLVAEAIQYVPGVAEPTAENNAYAARPRNTKAASRPQTPPCRGLRRMSKPRCP